jgi:hypothetical protein
MGCLVNRKQGAKLAAVIIIAFLLYAVGWMIGAVLQSPTPLPPTPTPTVTVSLPSTAVSRIEIPPVPTAEPGFVPVHRNRSYISYHLRTLRAYYFATPWSHPDEERWN